MDTESWTLDELARRAGQALAADAVRAPNGRVRERPDGRAIRWYATIGLVDRPFTGPGRAARYGPRHLLQLVAVKRLQALGRSLAEIQAELTGATEATLRRIADLPEDAAELAPEADSPAEVGGGSQPPKGAPARFWATRPDPTSVAAPSTVTAPAAPIAPMAPAASAPAPAARTAKPAAAPEPIQPNSIDSAENTESTASTGSTGSTGSSSTPAPLRYELALSDTVSLTIPNLPDAADLAAVRAGAASLLQLLASRGLTTVQGVHDEY